ncbi:MAG TPA: glycosyltransferase family 2 protein [Acidimicrobiales bacterium]|nr:glycosyltransferase family 2 protein [Acidimicrobiales bacterium]
MTARSTRQPTLSVVVPVFNEVAAVPVFLEKLDAVLSPCGVAYEVVFVDDGSEDDTWGALQAARSPQVRCLRLSRNFGKEAALTAGLDFAAGQAVVVMDVDLQDPPELLPEFLRLWEAGVDVVYGARSDRASDTRRKRWTARTFYRAFNALSDTRIPTDAGDFRLMDRAVVDVVRGMPERSRFMKGILSWPGFRTASVPYVRRPRAAGDTKWAYRSLWALGLDGLFNFSSKPLRVWGYLGSLTIAMGSCFMALVLVLAGLGQRQPSGYASLLGAVIILAGVQILGIGIVGEYLSRVFIEVKARPIYVLQDDGTPAAARRVRSAGGNSSSSDAGRRRGSP